MKGYNTQKEWHRLLANIINQYNSTIHNSTKLKPVNAIQDKDAVEVKTNLMLRVRFERKYKEIHVGDFRWSFKKEQKHSEMKEHVKNWTDKTYEVIEIDRSGINGQVSYKLDIEQTIFPETR